MATEPAVAGDPTTAPERPTVSAGVRIKAFAFDYLVIAGYLLVLLGAGSFLTFGPVGAEWSGLMADPARADFVAFLAAVLPVTLYFALGERSRAGATYGKRRVGLRVVRRDGGALGLPRSLVRSGLKFLPWQMAHTAMFHIPGFPMSPGEPPAWSTPLLVAAWSLVAIYLVGLTRIGGGRTPYDRVAGTKVVRENGGEAPERL